MSTFQVDSELVATQATAVRTTVSRIQGEVTALTSQLQSLQGSWTGQAATAFQGVVADWRVTQQRVEETLQALSTALAHAGQQYAEIEQQNARLFLR